MMLCFRGSDCRRSRGWTWYAEMDRLLMPLGFTESKIDSNICFKAEGRRPVILMLYIDYLFQIGKEELSKVGRRRLALEFVMKDLGMMHYFLGMEMWTRELCSRDPEEVQDDGLQGHDHTYGIVPKSIE